MNPSASSSAACATGSASDAPLTSLHVENPFASTTGLRSKFGSTNPIANPQLRVFVGGARDNQGVTVAVCEPSQAMSSCLDSVRATLPGLDDKAMPQILRDIETVSRQVQSVMLDVVAEVDARGIAAREGFGTTRRPLSAMLWLSSAEARTRVEQAEMVGLRRAMTGQTLAPQLPATAAALAVGEIGTGQLKVITVPWP